MPKQAAPQRDLGDRLLLATRIVAFGPRPEHRVLEIELRSAGIHGLNEAAPVTDQSRLVATARLKVWVSWKPTLHFWDRAVIR